VKKGQLRGFLEEFQVLFGMLVDLAPNAILDKKTLESAMEAPWPILVLFPRWRNPCRQCRDILNGGSVIANRPSAQRSLQQAYALPSLPASNTTSSSTT
jgi:hypothetical protein